MNQDKALRKRQQISKANRTMFITVAVAAAFIGAAIVLSVFLGQKLLFNEKILSKKQETVNTLEKNNTVTDDLKKNIRVLDTNDNLRASRVNPDDKALRVVLDALPSEANSSAFGASLQKVLLAGDGISVDTLTISSASGEEGSTTDETISSAENSIGFSFSVSTSADGAENLRSLLQRLERSIRIVNLLTYEIERQGSRLALKATAEAYYQPEVNLSLQEEVVRP